MNREYENNDIKTMNETTEQVIIDEPGRVDHVPTENCCEKDHELDALAVDDSIGDKTIVRVISKSTAVRIEGLLVALRELNNEIIARRDEALKQSEHFCAEAERIMSRGVIQFDKEQIQIIVTSVTEFVQVLSEITQEVEREYLFWEETISPNNSFIRVMADQEQSGDSEIDISVLLLEKAKMVQKYIKDTKKSISVGYSRYEVIFNKHRRTIFAAEKYSQLYEQKS